MSIATRPFHANHAPFLETGHDDPLAQALQPPPNESPDERALREKLQSEASMISRAIDEDLQEARKAFERRKKAVKILLLGQAESGKSTTLKNFQLAFSPQHFRSEKLAWKTIIQLNLIRNIKQLLQALEEEWNESQTQPGNPGASPAIPTTPSQPIPISSPIPIAHNQVNNHAARSVSPSRALPVPSASPRGPRAPPSASPPPPQPPIHNIDVHMNGVNGADSSPSTSPPDRPAFGMSAQPYSHRQYAGMSAKARGKLPAYLVPPLPSPPASPPASPGPGSVNGHHLSAANGVQMTNGSHSTTTVSFSHTASRPPSTTTTPIHSPQPSPAVTPMPTLQKPPAGREKSREKSIRFSTSPLNDSHRRIRLRLLPLMAIEEELTKKLFPEINNRNSFSGPTSGTAFPPGIREVCVRAGSGWKGVLSTIVNSQDTNVTNTNTYGNGNGNGYPNGILKTNGTVNGKRRPGTADGYGRKDDPTTVLSACREDILQLWDDPVVQGVLKKRGVRLQDMPGFFLNDASRIAQPNYEPSDDDIVRARLRTLGVEEHRFTMESGAYPGSEWYIYDVGGSRSMRPHWIPYFDDVQAIIFLAPLAFNLMLEEDSKVNRLEDSISLWRQICKNKLLEKTTMILFLNKMDILQATLAAGIMVKRYVPSYGDLPNDVTHVVKYFRDKFRGYHKRDSPQQRPFYWHETSVIDTRATSIILVGVREGILRAHLQSVNVI
ncbi:hypothetical protein QCA50_017929 [Cerrena zonata]|uniref:G-alpha-domain-containing protein n=1 Tax=Cerrena zonata TaxID=2478898 RepID=A0AAW0FE52_9APHY